jgi:hypothetical protein
MPEPAVSPSPAPSSPPPAARSPDPGLVIGSNPTVSEPQRRWAEERSRIQESDVWQQDPTRTTIRKSSDGTVTAVPRTANPVASPDPAKPADQQQPQPQQQPRTSDGRIILAEGIEVSEQELRDLVAHKAQTDSQKLTTPKPGEYQLKFNDDFVLPQGVEWRWDEANPLLAQVREFASTNNMSQAAFSRLLQMHAASRMNEDMAFAEAKAAEVRALGDSANQRVDAVKTWLRAMAPEHFAPLARVLEMAPNAGTVRGLEVLMQRYVSQGGASFNGSNREPEVPGKISQEAYDKLGYAARLEYASRFQQPTR